jgi:3-(3-hydroxy-phenyl)propionate hydroxylase
MHTPSTTPRPSLYFPYRVHEPWLPQADAPLTRHPVVIAGSGPAALVTALELARHGVRSVVCTVELQFSQGSRAICFTRCSLEILQQVGVADRMMAHGLPWRFGNSFYRGQRVFRMEAPQDDDDRFAPVLNIQQQFMEQYLYEACQQSPLIDFRWGNKVDRVDLQDEGVVVSIDTPAGPYEVQADWLVAADGGRSAIRSQLQLPMEGASYEGFFVIADIRIDLPLPTERLAFFDPPWNPGNTILMHREPHGIWRVDYQLPPGESPEQALRPESLKARIDAQLEMIGFGGTPWEMDWNSVYSARTLTLPDYLHGRVVFTGDAAHLLPIFGVRGANTAFQDAQSLGWHLAYTVRGLAGPDLMRNHSAERVGAAREIIEESGKSTRFMTPPSRGFRVLRDAVLSLSLTQAFVRPLYHWRTSRPHEYTHSALNSHDDDDALFQAGPAKGAPPSNVCLAPGDYLLDHLGAGFDLLYFTSGASVPQALVQQAQAWRARGVGLRITALGSGSAVAGADQTLVDGAGRARAKYGVRADGAAYLLRPDQHVCARWVLLDANRLEAALQQALRADAHAASPSSAHVAG